MNSSAERAVSPPEETVRASSDGDALEHVRAVAARLAPDHGLELVAVEWTANRAGRVLRVIIDRSLEDDVAPPPAGADVPVRPGATLDDCVRLSRELSRELDEDERIDHAYSLEVSSPGLDRPLREAADFRRQVGRLAKVKLETPAVDGQSVLRGTIIHADETHLRMRVDGNEHEVELGNVREAKLVFELGTKPKPGNAAKRKQSRKASKPRRKKGKR